MDESSRFLQKDTFRRRSDFFRDGHGNGLFEFLLHILANREKIGRESHVFLHFRVQHIVVVVRDIHVKIQGDPP